MNILFKIGGTVVTPPVGDTILAGITKDSVLKLFGPVGRAGRRAAVTIEEVLEAHTDGSLEEVFGRVPPRSSPPSARSTTRAGRSMSRTAVPARSPNGSSTS